MKNSSMLQMVIRSAGLVQLILGLIVWIGKVDWLTLVHILVGSIFTLALLMVVYQAYQAGVLRWLVLLAGVWALVLPAWGLAQEHIFPAAYLWVSQVLHILCAIGAMWLAEMLAARTRKMGAAAK